VQAVQPFGWAPVGGSNYFTRNESSAKRIGGLVPVYLQPATPVASDSDVRRDAARYRWLVKNCFDWAAPGDGDSFDHIELHFEHDMLNRDDESVGAAIDSEIDRALTAAQSASRGQA
jgi:hypothetical protein